MKQELQSLVAGDRGEQHRGRDPVSLTKLIDPPGDVGRGNNLDEPVGPLGKVHDGLTMEGYPTVSGEP